MPRRSATSCGIACRLAPLPISTPAVTRVTEPVRVDVHGGRRRSDEDEPRPNHGRPSAQPTVVRPAWRDGVRPAQVVGPGEHRPQDLALEDLAGGAEIAVAEHRPGVRLTLARTPIVVAAHR